MDRILCIGVDVSSRTFEASLGPFAAWCGDPLANALVVCEATGGYEAAFIGFLVARGVRIHRATPYLVKSYIRSLGLKAKTDRIDARALARYGAERGADLAPYRPPPESQRELAAVLTRREELVAMRVAETNRSRQPLYADPTLARSLAAVLATLNCGIAGLRRAPLRSSPPIRASRPASTRSPRSPALDVRPPSSSRPACPNSATRSARRRQPRRLRPASARQRDHAGPQNRLGRTHEPQRRPLHGRHDRTKPRPRHARLLRTPRPQRQTQNGRHRRRHAQNRRDRERRVQPSIVSQQGR